jgi:hypothetical protein
MRDHARRSGSKNELPASIGKMKCKYLGQGPAPGNPDLVDLPSVAKLIEQIVRQSRQAAKAVGKRRRGRTAGTRDIECDHLDILQRCRERLDQLQICPDAVEDEERRQARGSTMNANPQWLINGPSSPGGG